VLILSKKHTKKIISFKNNTVSSFGAVALPGEWAIVQKNGVKKHFLSTKDSSVTVCSASSPEDG
jgi:hypothetical protein